MSRGEVELWLYSFFILGARRGGWSTPRSRSLYPWERDPVPFVQGNQRAPGPVCTSKENLAPPQRDSISGLSRMYMTTDYFTGRVTKMWTFYLHKTLIVGNICVSGVWRLSATVPLSLRTTYHSGWKCGKTEYLWRFQYGSPEFQLPSQPYRVILPSPEVTDHHASAHIRTGPGTATTTVTE